MGSHILVTVVVVAGVGGEMGLRCWWPLSTYVLT